ncbi:MAG: hypothetical protein CFE31_11005 [Rhizobiales bacterium PAR1]|nr:MAG: hypothetical protein CFE31_11005 [Rhizobiales bacterium PAR1]
MKWAAVAVLALTSPAALAAPAVAPACPLLRAVYTPIEDEGFGKIENYELFHSEKTLPFNQAKAVITIRAPANGLVEKMRSYDFGFAFTNGYGGTHLEFSGESAKSARYKLPRGESEDNVPGSLILYFDEDLKTVEPLGEGEQAAPAYLLMPDIGRKFWYWQKSDRTFVPPGTMWKRTSCRNT